MPPQVPQYVVDAGFKYRFYPTEEQSDYLARTFGCVRVVYNRALDARKKHYAETGKGLRYGKTSVLLTQWKKEEGYRWLREVSSVPLQQTLRHLGTAFQRFFEKKAGHPRFKSRHLQSLPCSVVRSLLFARKLTLFTLELTQKGSVVSGVVDLLPIAGDHRVGQSQVQPDRFGSRRTGWGGRFLRGS